MLKNLIISLHFVLLLFSATSNAEDILEEWKCSLKDHEWLVNVASNGESFSYIPKSIKKEIIFRKLKNGNYEIKYEDIEIFKELTPKFSDKWVTFLLDSDHHEGVTLKSYGLWKKGGDIEWCSKDNKTVRACELPNDFKFFENDASINEELIHRLAKVSRDEVGVLMMTTWRVGWGGFGFSEIEKYRVYGFPVSEPESQISICSIK